MTLKRPIFDLLQLDLPESQISEIVTLVRDGSITKLTTTLKPVAIDEQLKHDLWDLCWHLLHGSPGHQAVSDGAAREIFREVLREYQAFNELGTKERRGVVQEFLLSVESQCRLATTCDFTEFRHKVLESEKYVKSMDPQVLLAGRYFAASGIWPVTIKA